MSAQKLENLYPRAPRYVIQVDDNQIVRFAALPKGSKAMHTRVVNLSESGMAFLMPVLNCPQLEEVIKLEFQPPGSEAIACFAKVSRVENHFIWDESKNKQCFKFIAVEFLELPGKQRKILADSLGKQFHLIRKRYQREQLLRKVQWGFFIAYNFAVSSFKKIVIKKSNEKHLSKVSEDKK